MNHTITCGKSLEQKGKFRLYKSRQEGQAQFYRMHLAKVHKDPIPEDPNACRHENSYNNIYDNTAIAYSSAVSFRFSENSTTISNFFFSRFNSASLELRALHWSSRNVFLSVKDEFNFLCLCHDLRTWFQWGKEKGKALKAERHSLPARCKLIATIWRFHPPKQSNFQFLVFWCQGSQLLIRQCILGL